jgi:hypothetical protein
VSCGAGANASLANDLGKAPHALAILNGHRALARVLRRAAKRAVRSRSASPSGPPTSLSPLATCNVQLTSLLFLLAAQPAPPHNGLTPRGRRGVVGGGRTERRPG